MVVGRLLSVKCVVFEGIEMHLQYPDRSILFPAAVNVFGRALLKQVLFQINRLPGL